MEDRILLTNIKEKLHGQLTLLSEQYQVKSLGMFGSYVRHEQSTSSDLDLLVAFNEMPGLLKFIEL